MSAELIRAPRPWYESRDNLADLYAYVRENEPHVDVEYMLRKPWKHEDLYDAMRRREALDRLADEAEAAEDEEWRDMQRRAAL